MSLPEKQHRDDEAKIIRPPELIAPNQSAAPQDPAAEHTDAQAAVGMANVAVSNDTKARAAALAPELDGGAPAKKTVGVPSAAGRAEAMQLFREENGGPGEPSPEQKKKGIGRPPSAKDSAEAMELFREENGGPGEAAPDVKARAAALAPELDGGAPTKKAVGVPSAAGRAEAMELFREENGGPGEAAPDVKARAAALAPELDGGAPAKNTVGVPSAAGRAEAMELFREENGGPGEAAPDVKARAAALAPELDGGAPAKKTVGVPSAAGRAEAMELFREENGGPGEAAPDVKVGAATAVNGPDVRASSQTAHVAPQFNDLTPTLSPAKQAANAARLAPELDGGAPSADTKARAAALGPELDGGAPAKKTVGVPSAAGRAEAMELFREENGGPGEPSPDQKAKGIGRPPSAKNSAEAMELFREVNGGPGEAAPDVKARAAALAPELDGGAPAKKTVGVSSAAGRAEAMELFREENGGPGEPSPDQKAKGIGRPPSAKNSAEAMELFREVNGGPGEAAPDVKARAAALAPELDGGAPAAKPAVGHAPSAKNSAEAMELFREVNGGPGEPSPEEKAKGIGRPPSKQNQAEAMELFREVNGGPSAAAAVNGPEVRASAQHAQVAPQFGDLTAAGSTSAGPASAPVGAAAATGAAHAAEKVGGFEVGMNGAPGAPAGGASGGVAQANSVAGFAVHIAGGAAAAGINAPKRMANVAVTHAEDAKDASGPAATPQDAAAQQKPGLETTVGAAKEQAAAHAQAATSQATGISKMDHQIHAPAMQAVHATEAPHAPDPAATAKHAPPSIGAQKPAVDPHAAMPKVDGHGTGLLVDPRPPAHDPEPIVDAEGKQHPYNPHAGHAPAPHASGSAAHAGAAAAPQFKVPDNLKSANQSQLDAFIAKAAADRDAQKAKLQAQQLAKSAKVGVDAQVIAAQVKQKNEKQLAAIRAKADQDKALAEKRAKEQQQQQGPVTIESLKEKLESSATADKEKLKIEFDAKRAELATRLKAEKDTLAQQSQDQINNFKTQQEAKKKEADAAWTKQKTQMDQVAKDLMVQMRQQTEADQKRLEADKDKLWKAANDKMNKLDADTKAKAAAVLSDGESKAGAAESRANSDAAAARAAGKAEADRLTAQDKDANTGFFGQASGPAAAAISSANARATDIETKGKLNAKSLRAEAKKQSDAVTDAGKKAHDDINNAATNQVAAIGKKINELGPLAQDKIKKADADLKAKTDAGEAKLKAQFADTEAKIAKLKADADAKIAKLDTDALTKLEKDFATATAAIDKRVEIARAQLASGNEKNIKQLEAMVDTTCKAIDKTVTDTEKQFEHTVLDAEKQAQAFIVAQLQKIKAEADKAIDALDKAYENVIAQINAAAANTTKQIEDTAKGKMLEVEVHTATMLADTGDKSRLDKVQDQLKYYIEHKQALPAGYGETAAPEPEKKPADGKDAKPAANDNKDKKDPATGEKKDEEDPAEIAAKKAADEARQKLLDPSNLSTEGIQAKLEESLKKGQRDTADAHAQTGTETVDKSYKDATKSLTKLENKKNKELADVEAGDPKALEEVHKAEADKAAGEQAAADINKAMQHKNWYGGSSPDKKQIMKALEGATPETLEAMRAALKAQTPSIDLDDYVRKNMSGNEQQEALVRLSGDPLAGDIAALTGAGGHHMSGNEKLLSSLNVVGLVFNAANGDKNIGADPARIQEILNKYPAGSDEQKRLIAAFEKTTGRPMGEFLQQAGAADAGAAVGIQPPKKDERSEDEIKADAGKDVTKLGLEGVKNGTIKDPGACAASASDLVEALGGFHLDSTRADKVRANLEGKSQAEIDLIKAEYLKRTGRSLDADLDSRLTGPALAEAKANERGDKTTAVMNKVLGAEQSGLTPWTLDDKQMTDTLKELKDPAERRAVLDAYEKRTGKKLQEDLAAKMTGNDRELATALADGDEMKARMVELDEATNGGWLNGMHKAIAERTGINTEPFTRGIVNGVAGGLLGPVGAAASLFVPGDARMTLPGGYEIQSGSIHKIDSDKIFELLEQTPNPEDRERLKALYKEKTGHDMDTDMQAKLVGPSGDPSKLDAYKAIQDGRMEDYYAARMDDAVSGLNDTKAFHAQLEGKSEMERKAIIDAYNKRHPETPDAFNHMLDEQFGADSMDKQKAQLLATSKDDPTTGAVKLPDEFVLKYAQDSVWNRAAKSIDSATAVFDKYPFLYAIPIVGQGAAEMKGFAYMSRGWGVDNDAIKNVLKGKNKDEIKALTDKYPDLEKDLTYCLSGRDAFEVQLMLKEGEPQTDEEKIKRKLALYEFDRGDSGAWIPGMNKVSNAFTDLISPSGKMMDEDAASMRSQLELLKQSGQLPPEAQLQLQMSLGAMDKETGNFIEARGAVTEAVAAAVGAVVGAVVTVLTGGVAGAILAALATGMATVATKVVMLGQSYGRNEMGVDIAMTAVQMATAGLGGGLSKLSESFLVQVLNGAIGAAASNFAQTAITSKDAHDLLGLLAHASQSGLIGMLSGGANAAATAAIASAMQSLSAKAFGPNAPLAGVFAKGFISGAGGSIAGTFAEAMVDPDTMSGNWDAVFAKLAQGAATAGFQNGLTEAAGAHRERMEQVHERAQSAVEAVQEKNGANRNIAEEQAAFAKAMKEGYEGVIAEQEAKAKAAKDPQQAPSPDEIQKQREEHPASENPEPQQTNEDPQVAAKDEKVGDQSVDDIKQKMDELAATKGAEEQRSAQKLDEPALPEKPGAAPDEMQQAAAAHETAVERETQRQLEGIENPTQEQIEQAKERARLKVVNDEIEAPLEGKKLIEHQEQREDIEREFANGQKPPEDLAKAAAMHEEEVQAKLDELTAKQEEDIKNGKLKEEDALSEDQLREKARGAVVEEELKTGIPDKTLEEQAGDLLKKGAEKVVEKLAGKELVEVMKLLELQEKNGQITNEEMGKAVAKIMKELAGRLADLYAAARGEPELAKNIKEVLELIHSQSENDPRIAGAIGETANALLDKGQALVEKVNPKKPGFMEGLPAVSDEPVVLDKERTAQREQQEAKDAQRENDLASARAHEDNLAKLMENASPSEAAQYGQELENAKAHREGLEEQQRRIDRIDAEVTSCEGEYERAIIADDPRAIAEAKARLDSARSRRDHVAELPPEYLAPAPEQPKLRIAVDPQTTNDPGPAPLPEPEQRVRVAEQEPERVRIADQDPERVRIADESQELADEDAALADAEPQRKQLRIETESSGGGGGDRLPPDSEQAPESEHPKKQAKTPEELAKDAQMRANRDREEGITPKQRETFDAIDQLALDAHTPSDFEYIRKLEVEAGRPVSERFSHNDDEAVLQAQARERGSHGLHDDGTPVTAEEHRAAIAETQRELVDGPVEQKSTAHDQAVDELTAEQKAESGLRDQMVTQDIVERARTSEDGTRKEVSVDAAISLGMGGAGAAGAHGDQQGSVAPGQVRSDRIGIEDVSKPELWGTLGHKEMGQEADAISYGRDGVRTSDVAEHNSAMPAKASDVALQVAAQRNSSGVGTVGSEGAIGSLEFTPIKNAEGKVTGYEVGVPTKVQTGVDSEGKPIIETIIVKTKQGVDISTGMGPSRELSTQDSGPRKAQMTPEDAAALKATRDANGQLKENGPQMLSGDAALALPAEAFQGERVLGIGGGPTSEWAMEHAVNGGAASVEVAGQMPRPKTGKLAAELNQVESQIRDLVKAGKPVSPELTEEHHRIIEAHVEAQREQLAKLNDTIKDPATSALQRERAEQERAKIAADIDPFLGSRVDRNHDTLNSDSIKHVQADVIQVKPIEEAPGKMAVEVTYADGTTRVVDRVIPSIGANPDAPGGINNILKNAPPEMKLIPVINEGRVVGLESQPAGISVSGAAMVGTLGTNMPPEVLKRIPPEMRDAVVASIIDHASREGVSAGSRGIVPGIENVGSNTELTIEAIKKIPPEKRSQDLQDFLDAHQLRRETQFDGEDRFPDLQPKPAPAAAAARESTPATAEAHADAESELKAAKIKEEETARKSEPYNKADQQQEALAGVEKPVETSEQRAQRDLLEQELKRQVQHVGLAAEVVHNAANKNDTSVVSLVFGDIKRVNDVLVGQPINTGMLRERDAIVREEFGKRGIKVVDQGYKSSTFASELPPEQLAAAVSEALAAVDQKMKGVYQKTLETGIAYWEREAQAAQQKGDQGALDNANHRLEKIHQEMATKLGDDFKFPMSAGAAKVETASGRAATYSDILSADMNANKAARMGTKPDEPRLKSYEPGEYVDYAKQTVTVRNELKGAQLPFGPNGELMPIMRGDAVDRDILRAARKGKVDTSKFNEEQLAAYNKLLDYMKRVNSLDYMKHFTTSQTPEHAEQVRHAQELIDKLHGSEPLTPAESRELQTLLHGERAQQDTASEAQFYNGVAATNERVVLNADIRDMGLTLFDSMAEHIDGIAKGGDVRKMSSSAADNVVTLKQQAHDDFARAYRDALAEVRRLAAGNHDTATLEALDREPKNPLVLLGGDELTVSLPPAFEKYGVLADLIGALQQATLGDNGDLGARVAITRTQSGGREGHIQAMEGAQPGHDQLKSLEQQARDLRENAKFLDGDNAMRAEELAGQMAKWHTDDQGGGAKLIDEYGQEVTPDRLKEIHDLSAQGQDGFKEQQGPDERDEDKAVS